MNTLILELTNTKVIPRIRRNSRTNASYYSKPKLYVFLKGETILEDFQGGRWNKPHNQFKKQLLSYALKEAGFDPHNIKAIWSQNAGCNCGCSPGFILSSKDKITDLGTIDIFCDYEIVH
jgi:hypothetical protein